MGWKIRRGKKGSNKKIKNATPLEVDGIQFRSKLEAYCYRQLTEAGIKSAYEENTYTLIPAFEFNGEKVRPCTYTPDFVGDTFIIEVKGFANDVWPVKCKMFKQYLVLTKDTRQLYIPKNQKEVLEVINEIKARQDEIKKKTT